MDKIEKKQLRDKISEYLDVSGTRLTDYEALRLGEFIDGYGKYRGRVSTRSSSRTAWSSDGKYIRHETFTDTFIDDVGIEKYYAYQDDDGDHREETTVVKDARGILNWLNEHGE